VDSILIGFVSLGLFVATYLYLIDTFGSSAAGALAIATFARYVAAGAMVPVSIPMYENLGVHTPIRLVFNFTDHLEFLDPDTPILRLS
jgi:Na+/H+ antiporter NhaC